MDDLANNAMENVGNIRIADEVIATLAGIATTEVEGVVGMSGTIAGEIAEILGKKNLAKGVKIERNGDLISIDLHLIVNYGVRIPEVAWEVQEKVKKTIESITGLEIEKINIYIESVYIEKEPHKEAKPSKAKDATQAEAQEDKKKTKDEA